MRVIRDIRAMHVTDAAVPEGGGRGEKENADKDGKEEGCEKEGSEEERKGFEDGRETIVQRRQQSERPRKGG